MKYNLLDVVQLKFSGTQGEIISRCESTDLDEQYKLRFVNGDGDLVENWYFVSAIEGIVDECA